LYQQNPYQQQGFGGQQQSQGQHVHLQDQDLANLVLSELKRIAREYTTAALEANNPQIRQVFQNLLGKTLQDQDVLYREIQRMSGYGEIPTAQQQDVHKELQKQSQTANQLYSFVQQHLSGIQQQGQGFSNQSTFQQPFYPNQMSNQTTNAWQSQQPLSYTGPQVPSQEQAYGQSQGYGQQQGMGLSSSSGLGTQQSQNQSQVSSAYTSSTSGKPASGYSASATSLQDSSKSQQQSTGTQGSASQQASQASQTSPTSYTSESSTSGNNHEGSKYSF
jgi:spore coat protein CotF